MTWEAARGLGLGIRGPAHLPSSLPAEEPTFRCDACDELFQSKLDLRRHKKYACSSVGAALCEGLAEELKPEGLGGGGGDGQAHECKDCERIFPTEYRCCISPPPLRSHPGCRAGPWEGALGGAEVSKGQASVPSRAARLGQVPRPSHRPLGTEQARELAVGACVFPALTVMTRPLVRAPYQQKSQESPGRAASGPAVLRSGPSCGDRREGS